MGKEKQLLLICTNIAEQIIEPRSTTTFIYATLYAASSVVVVVKKGKSILLPSRFMCWINEPLRQIQLCPWAVLTWFTYLRIGCVCSICQVITKQKKVFFMTSHGLSFLICISYYDTLSMEKSFRSKLSSKNYKFSWFSRQIATLINGMYSTKMLQAICLSFKSITDVV